VEEYVIVCVVRRYETIAACVVEEINLTVCHCNSLECKHRDKGSVFVIYSGVKFQFLSEIFFISKYISTLPTME
jgi:hypothetical protein